MYARQTRITGDPANVDKGIEHVRATVLPALDGCDGFRAFTLIVDRERGELIGTAFFDSLEAVEASEAAIRGPREAAAAVIDGDAPQVRILEVAIDTRA